MGGLGSGQSKMPNEKQKYLVYIQANFEVESEDEQEAEEAGDKVLDKLIGENDTIRFTVDSARIADKKSGFFVTK